MLITMQWTPPKQVDGAFFILFLPNPNPISPGANQYLELQIRQFCRQVLLDTWLSRKDCVFWLTRILSPWPMVSQARLLFILYGPLLPDGESAKKIQ